MENDGNVTYCKRKSGNSQGNCLPLLFTNSFHNFLKASKKTNSNEVVGCLFLDEIKAHFQAEIC